MVLSDKDIRKRLASLIELGVKNSLKEVLELTKERKIPQVLKSALEKGKIIIEPRLFSDDLIDRLGPVSLDLRLGDVLFDSSEDISVIDFSQPVGRLEGKKIILSPPPARPFILEPGQFILGVTNETIMLPSDLMGIIIGRSQFARRGLSVQVGSFKFDPGFIGNAVLEISNISKKPITLYSGLPICQIIFMVLSSPSERYFVIGGFLGQDAP